MGDSIRNNGQVQSGAEVSEAATSQSQGIPLKKQTSQGFSTNNTAEVMRSADTGILATPLSLDVPDEQAVNGDSVTSSISESALSGLQASVGLFSSLDLESLDTYSTSSILLLVKGAVSNMKALFGAEQIDTAFSAIMTEYNDRFRQAEELVNKKNNLNTKIQEMNDSQARFDELKEQEEEGSLSSSEEEELAYLRNLRDSIDGLSNDIARDEATLGSELSNDFQLLLPLLQNIRQRFDGEAVETGEDQRVATDMANRDLAASSAADSERVRAIKQELKELFDELIEEHRKRDANIENQQALNQLLQEFGRFAVLAVLLGSANVQAMLDKGELDSAVKPADRAAIASTAKTFSAIIGDDDRQKQQMTKVEAMQTKVVDAQFDPKVDSDTHDLAAPQLRNEPQEPAFELNMESTEEKESAVLSQQIDQLLLGMASTLKLQSDALHLVAQDQRQKEEAEGEIRRNSKV